MTGKDLLTGLGNIGQKYYDEAENEMPHRKAIRKPLLIAAIIALTVLLVGCAVAYALRLQDMSIGQETYTQSFDDKGKAIDPTEKTRDIITIYGHSGDNIQLALKDWFDFLENYDPDGELMDNNPDHPEIPNQYEYIYSCYTTEMVAKVDAIAAKYDLKLLENRIPFQRHQSHIFFEETGIKSFVLPNSGAEINSVVGMLYEPYNFSMEFKLSTDKVDIQLWGSIDYARKDYFPRAFPGGMDLSHFDQWDHTSPDGTPLLLALSNKGSAYIIAEPENAMLILHFDGNFSGSAYPEADEIITKEQLEAVADLFDYSIDPNSIDRNIVEARLAEEEADYQAEHAYTPETYGSFTEYLTKMYTLPYQNLQYTFYDLTGDGEKELLIGENGSYRYWVTLRDGEALEQMVMNTYLCEGGTEERYSAHEIYESHIYVAPVSPSVIDDIGAERSILTIIKRNKDQWTVGPTDHEQTPITEADAMAIMAHYPRLELDWDPLMEYPISAEQTLGEYIDEKDVRVSNPELLEIYKNKLNSMKDMYYSHYRLLDINGDGVEDLLLKGEGDSYIGNTDYYWMAMTYRYGRIVNIASDFYLCEDGVLEHVERRHDTGGPGVEINGHQFMRLADLNEVLLDFVAYNKATASWQGDWWNEKPLTEAEANAVLEKYPRIDQGMRPISELLG